MGKGRGSYATPPLGYVRQAGLRALRVRRRRLGADGVGSDWCSGSAFGSAGGAMNSTMGTPAGVDEVGASTRGGAAFGSTACASVPWDSVPWDSTLDSAI